MSKKVNVSLNAINQIMCLLIEGMSGQPQEIFGLNMTNENSVKLVVERYLLPEFQSEPYRIQQEFKASLNYAINFFSEKSLQNSLAGEQFIVDFPDDLALKEFYKMIPHSQHLARD